MLRCHHKCTTTCYHATLVNYVQHLKILLLCRQSTLYICMSCQDISYFVMDILNPEYQCRHLQPTVTGTCDIECLFSVRLNSQVSPDCPLHSMHLQNSSRLSSPELHCTVPGAFLFSLARDKMCWKNTNRCYLHVNDISLHREILMRYFHFWHLKVVFQNLSRQEPSSINVSAALSLFLRSSRCVKSWVHLLLSASWVNWLSP